MNKSKLKLRSSYKTEEKLFFLLGISITEES